MSVLSNPANQNSENYLPNEKPAILRMAEELYNKNNIQKRMVLEDVPIIGYGSMEKRDPTDYTVPGCLGNILSYIDAREKIMKANTNNKLVILSESDILSDVDIIGFGQPTAVTIDNKILDNANQMLMNVTGVSYGTLWADDFDDMVSELTKVNDIEVMVNRSLRYYGRDYILFTHNKKLSEEQKKAIVVSINRGHPVMIGFACGVPEYSIITGYDDYGDTLIGWVYCNGGLKRITENGMFILDTDADNKWDIKLLIIGDKNNDKLSDKEIVEYAMEVMERKISQHTSYKTFTAGITALEKFRTAMADTENGLYENPKHQFFLHLMILNIAEPRAFTGIFINKMKEKYAENKAASACLDVIDKLNFDESNYARAMWGVKDDKTMSAAENRKRWCELLDKCISGEKTLLEKFNELTEYLNI